MRNSHLRSDAKIEVSRRDLNQSISLVDKILLELPNVSEDAIRQDLSKLRLKLSNMRPQRSLVF